MAITVRISELLNMVNKLNNDGIEYVDIEILEGEVFDDDVVPASLDFEAYGGDGSGIGYGTLDEVKVSATYKFD